MEQATPAFYLYVVECADGTWYTGYTVDVEQRVRAHNEGAGAKYTRSRRPVTLVAAARFPTKHEAMSAEWHFKRLSRKRKEVLVGRAGTQPFEEVLRFEFMLEQPGPDETDAGSSPTDSPLHTTC